MTISRINWLIEKQEGLTEQNREALERMQLKKLNALLKKEKERCGFYKHLPESLSSLSELASLPFCDDEALAEHAGSMLLVSQSEIQRVLSDATSGTTGKAKRVFTPRATAGTRWSFSWRGLVSLSSPAASP